MSALVETGRDAEGYLRGRMGSDISSDWGTCDTCEFFLEVFCELLHIKDPHVKPIPYTHLPRASFCICSWYYT